LLREFGVPVPDGDVADTPAKAREIAQRLGGKVVVKAQVHAGGRGKGGGIKVADGPDAAEAARRQIIGMQLKTPQTPPRASWSARCGSRRPPTSRASSISR
jgi:succinyl-CoA synthetase beta subunit